MHIKKYCKNMLDKKSQLCLNNNRARKGHM